MKPKTINLLTLLMLVGVVGWGISKDRKASPREKKTVATHQRETPAPENRPSLRTALDDRARYADTTVRTYTDLAIVQKRHDQTQGPYLLVAPLTGVHPGDWPANTDNLMVVRTDWDTYNRTTMGIVAEFEGSMRLCHTQAFGELPILKANSYKGVRAIGTWDLGLTPYFFHGECGKACEAAPLAPGQTPAPPPPPDPKHILHDDFLNGLYGEMLRCTKE